jgi:hypothetical protein
MPVERAATAPILVTTVVVVVVLVRVLTVYQEKLDKLVAQPAVPVPMAGEAEEVLVMIAVLILQSERVQPVLPEVLEVMDVLAQVMLRVRAVEGMVEIMACQA